MSNVPSSDRGHKRWLASNAFTEAEGGERKKGSGEREKFELAMGGNDREKKRVKFL